MKPGSYWWATLVFGAGILLIFIGRLFDSRTFTQVVLAGTGATLLLAMTALRLYTMIRSENAERGFERSLMLIQLLLVLGFFTGLVYDAQRASYTGLARDEYDQYHSVRNTWRNKEDAGSVVLWAAVIAGSLLGKKGGSGRADPEVPRPKDRDGGARRGRA